MARVTFDMHTRLPPEHVLAMLTDFSARKGKALIGLVVLTGGAPIRRKVFQRAFDRAVVRA
jgi:hypothetical protein